MALPCQVVGQSLVSSIAPTPESDFSEEGILSAPRLGPDIGRMDCRNDILSSTDDGRQGVGGQPPEGFLRDVGECGVSWAKDVEANVAGGRKLAFVDFGEYFQVGFDDG